MNGQEHFYLETSQCIVIPREDNELEVISSTQGVSDTQGDVANATGLPRHKIIVRVKRIGGGFGGKESTAGLFAPLRFWKPYWRILGCNVALPVICAKAA